jgi:putative heme-binding domain-containing protein
MLAALGKVEDPKLAGHIIAAYPRLDPQAQPLAIEILMQREPWMRQFLDAVIAKRMPASALHANHLRKVFEMNDREAIWLVERTWGSVRAERNPEQERLVAEMGEALRRTPGDPAAGEQVFKKLCVQCHEIHGQGTRVGPDLTGNGRASFDQLLSNVFDPSLVVGPGYQVFTVVTQDGRNVTGLLVEDGEQRVVLRLAGGAEETVPRREVKYVHASRLSMMPEGIERLFARQELADLFAFLALDRHPSDPEARPIPGSPEWLRPGGAGR